MKTWRYFLKHWPNVAVIAAILIVRPSISAWCGLKAGELFDAASRQEVDTVLRFFALLFFVWLGNNLLQYWVSLLNSALINAIRRDVKQDAFDALAHTTLPLFSQKDPGEYIATFTNDIVILETRYFSSVINAFSDIMTILIIGGSFLALDKTLAATILVGGALSSLLPYLFSRPAVTSNAAYVSSVETFTQQTKEFFSAFPTMRNYSVEDRFVERFGLVNEKVESAKFESEFYLQFINSLGGAISWFIRFAVVGIGLVKVAAGGMTLGFVMTAYTFSNELATPLQGIVSKLNSIRSVAAILDKFKKFEQEASWPSQEGVLPDASSYDVVFDGVSFSVGNNRIIKDVSFVLEAGKKYLVVGKNGSGKSTLFKLLKRYTDDYEGSIRIGGLDVRQLSFKQLSGLVSYMGEQVDVLSASVHENVDLFRDMPTELLEGALSAAQVNIPLDRVLRDSGSNISSGEKRRLELARTIASRTPIIIFDEVVSTLDVETAFEIEKTALSLNENTVVFISHNYSTILAERYDAVILIDDGLLVGMAPYHQLFDESALFRRIVEIKSGSQS